MEFETGIKFYAEMFRAEMYSAEEEQQLDDEESVGMPQGEPTMEDDEKRQQERHTADEEIENSGDATSASDDEVGDDSKDSVVDGGHHDKGADTGAPVSLKRSRSTDRQVAANKRLQERAELAMRKLIQGRLNFKEVLFAVCERKVGKPLPPHNFICREARLNLGLRMPTLATWVRDLAYQ
eukprot:SAG11_NODE_121_length_15851_cov_6.082466_5_plen_181_part_00